MRRITITVDDELVAAVDRVIAACGYQNRSEAIPDLAPVRWPDSSPQAAKHG
jgi:CopG family transcriptional regulator, nickel-responsive regulator